MAGIPLSRGVHVAHLFFRVDRVRWQALPAGESSSTLHRLGKICEANPGPGAPRIMTFAGVGGKADLAFLLFATELQQLGALQRDVELAFPAGTLVPAYSYLSVTELPEYVATDDDLKAILARDAVVPGHPQFEERFAAAQKRNAEYQHYRLYPELEDWEIMCFYPMNKKRSGSDNWFMLDFDTRKKLMGSHAKTGRKYSGRIAQLITGSAGIDDWEWGVTLMAHQLDAIKEIVYEMRFDEVSARYAEFGAFYISMRLSPAELWNHLRL
ncbi:MAG TPA: chlorite dismutase family protein [Verrucomicrobiota bacterium]|nr:heme peroxidase [Verrucomicrobiales bacterium]HRI13888.1 chlorite dismutase family protein [Verrucomicrobiota bacterium]